MEQHGCLDPGVRLGPPQGSGERGRAHGYRSSASRAAQAKSISDEPPWTIGSVWTVDFIPLKPGSTVGSARQLRETFEAQEKLDAATKRVFGSRAAVQDMARKREEIREALGSRLLRGPRQVGRLYTTP